MGAVKEEKINQSMMSSIGFPQTIATAFASAGSKTKLHTHSVVNFWLYIFILITALLVHCVFTTMPFKAEEECRTPLKSLKILMSYVFTSIRWCCSSVGPRIFCLY